MLLADKVTILNKYLNFNNVFLKESATKLPKYSDINKHVIDLEPSNQPFYNLIYSLGPIKLKTLKTYIKINLTNCFIWSSKSPAEAFILFVRKLNSSLRLYVNYCNLNNLKI